MLILIKTHKETSKRNLLIFVLHRAVGAAQILRYIKIIIPIQCCWDMREASCRL